MSFGGNRLEIRSLYLVAFAGALGKKTLDVLLPTYINLLEPSGVVLGLFITGLTAAQAVSSIPLGWAGEKYDKRAILLGLLGISGVAYGLFSLVTTSGQFVAARALQGLGSVGVGLLSLAMVGELAGTDERANTIGKYNALRLAAGVLGGVGVGALYDAFGFDVVFALLGVADAFREPASMALFADEGTDQGGVASSFGIRDIVWRPGSVVAPIVGGVVMERVGIDWVFFLAGALPSAAPSPSW